MGIREEILCIQNTKWDGSRKRLPTGTIKRGKRIRIITVIKKSFKREV